MVSYIRRGTSQKSALLYEHFSGVDFARSPSSVSPDNATDSVNMIRAEIGKVRKRNGYEKIFSYAGKKIHGIFKFQDDYLVHAGTTLNRLCYNSTTGNWETTLIYSEMNDKPSSACPINGKLYFVDGKKYMVYDGESFVPVPGYVPTISIAGNEYGGGTAYEEVNLLSNQWKQRFCTKDNVLIYQLAFDHLDDTPVTCSKLSVVDNKPTWTDLAETTDYTVDRVLGKLILKTNPGDTPISGHDNLIVTASKERSRQVIDKCDICVLYGLNGQENQIFMAGNPDRKNADFWSHYSQPDYIGELSYSELGQDNSAIVGYSKLDGYLATHKDKYSGDIYIRAGSLNYYQDEQRYYITFNVQNVLRGSGTIARRSFANFGEPLFLTKYGIQTITARDLTNRDYEQVRGDRVNKRLLTEKNLEDAIGIIYKDYYLLGVNTHVYVLDRQQKQYEPNQSSSEYQYTAFYWDNINASCFYCDDHLYFGTPDGDLMRFYEDESKQTSYNDNGQAIRAMWEFPQFNGNIFWSNKSFKTVFLKLKSAISTGAQVQVCVNGIWQNVGEDYISFGYWDFDYVDFNSLNFSTDTTPKKSSERINLKRLDKVAFRISNDKVNQPFGIESFGFLYSERGINKGEF